MVFGKMRFIYSCVYMVGMLLLYYN
uniref:Uncharacterized protein n=1 Tax=Arundo donax TaxID=35708 RepID=A0A0A9CFP6_ARUDO